MEKSIVIKIIAFILFGYISYKVVKYYFNRENDSERTLINQVTDFDESYSQIINRNDIFEPSANFSISWTMKVLNIPSNFIWKSSYTKNKPIILNGGCPNIYYNPAKNIIIIKFEMLNTNNTSFYKDIIIKNIKVQMWNKYILTVKGRNIAFYINGNLEYSYLLPTVPLTQKGSLKLGEQENNFLGKVTEVIYYNYPLQMNQIK